MLRLRPLVAHGDGSWCLWRDTDNTLRVITAINLRAILVAILVLNYAQLPKSLALVGLMRLIEGVRSSTVVLLALTSLLVLHQPLLELHQVVSLTFAVVALFQVDQHHRCHHTSIDLMALSGVRGEEQA